MKFGAISNEIHYDASNVSSGQVRELGERLTAMGLFGDKKQITLKLKLVNDTYEIYFPVKDGLWYDSEYVAKVTTFWAALQSAYPSRPIILNLASKTFDDVRLSINKASAKTVQARDKVIDKPARLFYSSTILFDERNWAIIDSSKYPAALCDSVPIVVKTIEPVYPSIAILAGIEGEVTCAVFINVKGYPTKTQPLRSSADIFNQPTVDAIQGWRFTPAKMNGHSVEVMAIMTFRFVKGIVLLPK